MNLIVSSSPHIRDHKTTQTIMLDVIISLIPTLIAAFLIFGYRSLLITCTAVISCVVFEHLSSKIMKRKESIQDLSAIVTAILLAYNVPVDCPLWVVIIGSLVAIVMSKMMFGGIGQNFANPAITARIVLLLSFPSYMSLFSVKPSFAAAGTVIPEGVDLVASATPLGLNMKGAELPSYLQLLLGQHAGTIGEVCALALIIGGLYLIIRGIIDIWIPLTYIGSVAFIAFISHQDPLFHVLSGGLLLGAIFMATDYVTSPATKKGKIIFGLGCGIITAAIRIFGSSPEGVSFSILVMNIMTPHINSFTKTKPVGGIRYAKG